MHVLRREAHVQGPSGSNEVTVPQELGPGANVVAEVGKQGAGHVIVAKEAA